MHLKHLLMPITTSSDLPLVNNREKHGIENSNHLFLELTHKQIQGQVELQDSHGSFNTVLTQNAHILKNYN